MSLSLSISFSLLLSLLPSLLSPSHAQCAEENDASVACARYGCRTDRFVTQAGRHAETRKRVDIYNSVGCRIFIYMSLSLFLYFYLFISLYVFLSYPPSSSPTSPFPPSHGRRAEENYAGVACTRYGCRTDRFVTQAGRQAGRQAGHKDIKKV